MSDALGFERHPAPPQSDLRADLMKLFNRTACPICTGVKVTNTAFCKRCYLALPHRYRQALWLRPGQGFEEAYMLCLGWHAYNPRIQSRAVPA